MDTKLYIKKRTAYEWLMFLVIFLPFVTSFFVELLGIPDVIKFITDIILLFSFLVIMVRGKLLLNQKTAVFFTFIVGFLFYCVITYVFNYQSVAYFAWGFRNNFRFYVAFLLFVFFVNESDIEKLLNLFDVFFYIHAAVTFVQFFFMGYRQDYLGGLFGVQKGCNAHVNILLCLILVKSVVCFLNKKENLALCSLKSVLTVIVAAMAELKFFFIEFIFIFLTVILITKFTWRKLFIIVSAVIGFFIGIVVLARVFPNVVGTLGLKALIETASSKGGYTNTGDLNRLTAIPIISKNIFTEPFEKLFGFGLGNCDLSSISIFNTPFYDNFSYLHYSWISVAFLFLELGFVGLIIFFAFFVLCFYMSLKAQKQGTAKTEYCQIAMIVSLLAVLLAVYNSSLRMECAYFVYFFLALPHISQRKII